ncbi:MAG: DinB family protein [Flavobacteriaceae bacterium]|nr:DinB family protein [Flavobacteriaceae bacterium]
MDKQFDILLKSRELVIKLIDGYTLEQLNKTPEGFGNNIIWNIAHLVVTQQLLCYKFSGVSMRVSDDMINKYMKGTSPKSPVSSVEFEEIKKMFLELPLQLESDFRLGVFKSYETYETSVNVTLTDIDSATAFNNLHEGIHLGVILALRKLV